MRRNLYKITHNKNLHGGVNKIKFSHRRHDTASRCQSLHGFTLVELLVVIAIIALLLSIVMPSLRKVKETAKTVFCNSNLHQWGVIFQMYTQDNDDSFHSGWINAADGHLLWPAAMRPYYDSPDIRVCPKAKNSSKAGTLGFWGPLPDTPGFWTQAVAGDYGSYGVNWYVCNRENKLYGMEGNGTENLWKKTTESGRFSRNTIPVLADAWWYCGTPGDDDRPPAYMGERTSDNFESMNRFCVDRHSGYVQMLFMDWSSRKVGLKELWTLKWHRSFNISNSYTIMGNGGNGEATATFWDAQAPWMSKYKEY